ncbi:MAG: hypothetical protein JW995_11930 [Melioribacteraceae bacterium]|nr:hypothetical protein [Melioribacteraceae bacterium]
MVSKENYGMMAEEQKLLNYIENVFRNSSSSDELFDTLNFALEKQINNIDLYKILLANTALTSDEITLYVGKLTHEFPGNRYELYNWVGNLFQIQDFDSSKIDISFNYYQKAFFEKPSEYQPLLSALKLYNYDYDIPANKFILQLVNNGVESVDKKSAVYSELSRHFEKLGKTDISKKYQLLAASALKKENQ